MFRMNHFSYSRYEYVHKRFVPTNKCFFLKINNNNTMAYRCIQKWLDVVNKLDRDYAFICDNGALKKHLLNHISFPDNKKIVFIRSKRKRLYKYTKALTFNSIGWRKMTVAHMMPFYLINSDVELCWHVDADDTFFVLDANDVAKVITNVEELMLKKSYDALSLDMWASRYEGKHWTFGVACIKNRINYRKLFENPNKEWTHIEPVHNFDGYFTYLYDIGIHNIGTFYVENSFFVHYGDALRYPIKWPISFWRDGVIHFPILKSVFMDKKRGAIPIVKNAIKIDIGLNKARSMYLLNNMLKEE